jgi:hypothetical protein
MVTLYERILHEKNDPSQDSEFTINLSSELSSVIASKLSNLLNISCGIDLYSYASPFTNLSVILDENADPELSYNFPYGKAYVYLDTKRKSLNVSFSFSNKVPVKLYKEMVGYLDVDHDMVFEQISFKRVIEYTKNKLQRKTSSQDWAALIIYTTIDQSLKKKNHFHYQNSIMYAADTDHICNLSDKGLNHLFISHSNDFDELLFIFLNFNEKYPALFQEVFPEQISYLDIINSENKMIKHLNMFYTQYSENKDLLISNISMLEMRVI